MTFFIVLVIGLSHHKPEINSNKLFDKLLII